MAKSKNSGPAKYPEFAHLTELSQLLQATRALPAPAGALLGWHHQLIHWGSWSSGETEPRISFAAEFVATGEKPYESELPLLDPVSLPPFNVRLRTISKKILDYSRFELPMGRYRGLATRLSAAA